ncbi:alpha/beta fold hydrolase [Diaphorobacter sp. HDW4A]|uniref:RBBP9/YdeN family alpha/beta hydrolase n=1 Tax=Diaphorobacter sp. HDW4A TaxID=2714924 RepID=UPI0014092781|nr:alpha/beta fold hydrolase [Diaphorobacter sp. HDW4A]QIL79684.1 alpha/beta fold hydrolase [Diaphorobacter sp. HDW4A]
MYRYPDDLTFVLVPGLRDHVEDHWQTHLQKELPHSVTVPPLEHDKLSRAARVHALVETLGGVDGPVVLVAHSAGVITTLHWAAQFGQSFSKPIRGALLATPADLDEPLPEGYPTQLQLQTNGWTPVPRAALPFPTILAASRNDPLARFESMERLAKDWGARLADLGEVGHLNPAAGYGRWDGVHALLGELARP